MIIIVIFFLFKIYSHESLFKINQSFWQTFCHTRYTKKRIAMECQDCDCATMFSSYIDFDLDFSWSFSKKLEEIFHCISMQRKDTLKLSANFLLSHYFWFTMSLHKHLWRQKGMESRLLIALIVIRNLAFYCDRNFWNLKTCRHKKHGVKTFSCSHCYKKFGLFWQEFLKLEDMKTQTF